MRVVCISDTHGLHQKLRVPNGDILIHAGDLTSRGRLWELQETCDWLRSLPHPHKVLIAGNHDFCLQWDPHACSRLMHGLTYLQDQEIEIQGFRIYGSPWQPWFHDWAFNFPRGDTQQALETWNRIPQGTHILVTHGPPHGILDQTDTGIHAGCEALRGRVKAVRPFLHVFGHIHEAYGRHEEHGIQFLNASTCDLAYRPRNCPWEVDVQFPLFTLQPEPTGGDSA